MAVPFPAIHVAKQHLSVPAKPFAGGKDEPDARRIFKRCSGRFDTGQKEVDYYLSMIDCNIKVKDNQKGLHEDLALFFQEPANGPFDTCETVDGDHGRIETRRYFTTSTIGGLPGKNE
jgi:hypothetical protein